MKKILLAIFGAAFLLVGCNKELQTYVEDLNTRVSALEDKVAQNETAIKALQTAVNQGVSIASVTENADGWLITLTDGNKYQLNHGKNGTDGTNGTNGKDGKDGKDGDSWITSVEIQGDIVVITTAQGELRIPYAKAFRLVIAQDVAVDPGIVKVPYSVENGTAATTVDAFASAPYIAEVTAETVDITVPTPAVKGNVLVWAEDGTLGKASIKKINLEGPYATVSEVTPVAGVGGTIEVPVVSNVEIAVLDETEDWLSYKETKATTYTVVLTAAANEGEARSSSVKVVRKSDNTVLETITIAQKAVAPVTLNGALEYNTIAEALTAAEALTEGEAVITLANKTFEEAVKIDGAKIAVPVTIDGGAKAKIVGGIEIYKNAATIKGLEITVAATSLTTMPGEYLNSAANGYAFGIQVNVPGYGATIKDNVINNDVANATAIYFAANDKDAAEGDLVTGNVLNCGTQRGMQVYGSINLVGNTIVSSKYPIRLGRGTTTGAVPQGTTKVVIAGNKFEAAAATATAIDVHATLTGCDITLGDGAADNNLYAANFTNRVNSLGTDNTWHPAITAPYVNGGNVLLNGYKFATIQAAVDAAAAITTGTAEITVPAATVVAEDVKIDGAKLHVPIVIDGTAQSSTVNGSFEIKGAEATIRNFTIVPTENSKTALAADGWYTNSFTTGVQINGSGFGAVLENLTINTTVDDQTGIWVGYKQGEKRDVIRNVTINGTGKAGRKIQAYDSILEIANCTFNGSYSYGVRIGGTGGSNVILKANRFNSAGNDGAAVGFQFNAFGESTVVLGDGTKNDNTQDGSYRSLFGAGNEWLFHNNNFFYPDLKYAAANNDLIVNETLGRVWAKWDEYDNTWDDAVLPQTTGNNWARHGVASGRYLYVPIAQAALANSGIAVFDVLTGEYLYKITEGIEDKGHFKVCSAARLGETVYVASMGMQSNGTPLVVYKLTTASPYFTKAEKVLEYTIPAGRLGDTMTGWGTNEEGVLSFVDYAQSGDQRASYLFQVKDGAVTNAAEPYCPPYMNTAGGNKMLGIYVFSGPGTVEGGHYALLTGNAAAVVRGISKWNKDGWYVQDLGGGVYADYATLGIFKHSVLDPTIMTIGGKQQIVYVTVNGKYASLRLLDVSGDGGLLARIYAIGDEAGLNARTNAYALAYPGNPAHAVEAFNVGNNGTGFVTTTVIDEVTYIVAAATEVGWSCFKVN